MNMKSESLKDKRRRGSMFEEIIKEKKFKLDKNYKPVDSGNSMNSKHGNHEESHVKTQYNEIAQNQQ